LRTVIESKANSLPYKLFEAGDCIVLDSTTDTGSSNVRKIAAVMTDEVLEGAKKNIFSTIHGSLDLIMKKSTFEFQKDYHLVPSNIDFFFPGQQFEVILKGEKVGFLGVVHPKVLRNFGWAHPTAMW
jgi:phenylalanyl-tRNA synthetase beta chain